jgi:hypothetical protein
LILLEVAESDTKDSFLNLGYVFLVGHLLINPNPFGFVVTAIDHLLINSKI